MPTSASTRTAGRPAAAGWAGLRQPGSLPYPGWPAGTDTIPQIEHIVVLMMENHSYDNQLGMLRPPGRGRIPARPGRAADSDATRTRDGRIQHAFRMPTHLPARRPARARTGWTATPSTTTAGSTASSTIRAAARSSMGYWQQADLPFYYSLASAFPIADRYFCSVLGQTYPNRRYLMAATSIGHGQRHRAGAHRLPGERDDLRPARRARASPGRTTPPRSSDARRCSRRCYVEEPRRQDRPDRAVLHRRRGGHAARVLPGRAGLRQPRPRRTRRTSPSGEQFAAQVINAVMPGPAWTEHAADLDLRRARRLLRPRAAARRDRARQHPARPCPAADGYNGFRQVRFPGAVRGRLALGPAGLRLAPGLRPHQHLRAGRGQVEPARDDRTGTPTPTGTCWTCSTCGGPGVPRPPRLAGPLAGHRPGRACHATRAARA